MPVYCMTSPSLSGLNLVDNQLVIVGLQAGNCLLLDGKLPRLAIFTNGLVHASIGTTADEANDSVSLMNPDLAGIAVSSHLARVGRFY